MNFSWKIKFVIKWGLKNDCEMKAYSPDKCKLFQRSRRNSQKRFFFGNKSNSIFLIAPNAA